jgi:NAD(P)-dependent dehydrogenase (short-subunit alcohol dehydrogenase family)
MFERNGARLPVGRVGRPEDIAEAYLYLIKTGFSTGETIDVDGGALQARRSSDVALRER